MPTAVVTRSNLSSFIIDDIFFMITICISLASLAELETKKMVLGLLDSEIKFTNVFLYLHINSKRLFLLPLVYAIARAALIFNEYFRQLSFINDMAVFTFL